MTSLCKSFMPQVGTKRQAKRLRYFYQLSQLVLSATIVRMIGLLPYVLFKPSIL